MGNIIGSLVGEIVIGLKDGKDVGGSVGNIEGLENVGGLDGYVVGDEVGALLEGTSDGTKLILQRQQ